MTFLIGRRMTDSMPQPFWSRDMRPAIDCLLDLQRLDLISMEAARRTWTLLRTDQDEFSRQVRILENEAAKAVALTTDALERS